MTKEMRKELENLIDKNGYSECKDFIMKEITFIRVIYNSFDISDLPLELVELISFLRRCKDIELYGTVKKDTKEKRKGIEDNISLKSDYLLIQLEKWVNTVLNYTSNYEFIDIPHKELEDIDLISYTEKYTDDELDKIITYERERNKLRELYSPTSIKRFYGHILSQWYNSFVKAGIFTTNNIEQKDSKKSITDEYSFLYDCLVIIDVIKENKDLKTRNEKQKDVKYCINSYWKDVKNREKRLP